MALLTDRLQLAINNAAFAHRRQVRKDNRLPYIVHPFSVAWILAQHTEDEDVIIAGLLHDVIEDVSDEYPEEQIRQDFGDRVLRLVQSVTEDKSIPLYRGRKQAYLDHLKQSSPETALISAADLLHNMRSMKADLEAGNPHIIEMQKHNTGDRLWFWQQRIEVLEDKLGANSSLLKELTGVFEQIQARQ